MFSSRFSVLSVLIMLALMTSSAMALPSGPVIGTVGLVLGDVTGTDQDGDTFVVTRGSDIHAGYTFVTGDRAFFRAEMNDGTRLTLGRNGEATIEGFSYNSAAQTGQFSARVALGGFHYASGDIGRFNAGRDHTTISTPSAVIGIRGSEADGLVEEDGRTTMILRSGRANVTSNTGESVTLTEAGNTAETEPDGDVDFNQQPTTQQQQKVDTALPTPAEVSQAGSSSGEEGGDDPTTGQQDGTTGEGASGDSAGASGGGGGSSDLPGSPSGAAPVN